MGRQGARARPPRPLQLPGRAAAGGGGRHARRGRQAAADQRALAGYIQAIRNKVEANWIRPPGATDVTCKVHVKQLPGGQVANVRVVSSCGGPALDRSVEQAIYKSDPLPSPPSGNLFQSDIEFTFRPDS